MMNVGGWDANQDDPLCGMDSRFIDGENKGLAKWAKDNASYFGSLWQRVQSYLRRDFPGVSSCTVFGEWCGPGVQKGVPTSWHQVIWLGMVFDCTNTAERGGHRDAGQVHLRRVLSAHWQLPRDRAR